MKLYVVSYKNSNQYSIWTEYPDWNPSLHSFSSLAENSLGLINKKLFKTFFNLSLTSVKNGLYEITYVIDKAKNRATITKCICIMGV